MAKPQKYPVRRMVRLSTETNELLSRRAKVMGLVPAVVLRIIVEHSLSGEPIPHVAVLKQENKK